MRDARITLRLTQDSRAWVREYSAQREIKESQGWRAVLKAGMVALSQPDTASQPVLPTEGHDCRTHELDARDREDLRWYAIELFDRCFEYETGASLPLGKDLSGWKVEYRLLPDEDQGLGRDL